MTCFGMKGAYQHPEVCIGWYPFVATQETGVWTKPGGGHFLGPVGEGRGLGRQSVRNPGGKPNPPMRRPVQGSDGRFYAWCYRRMGESLTGWVPLDHIKPHKDLRDPPLRGPARLDFEVGRTVPHAKSGPGCGKLSIRRPVLEVVAREAHFRYSAHGTSFHYAHQGDRLKVLLVKCPQGFVFTEVVSAARDGSLKRGARGYVLATAVGL